MYLCLAAGECEGEIHDVHTEPITCLLFDNAGRYVLTAGDKHVRVLHNVPGLKTAVQVSNVQSTCTCMRHFFSCEKR